MQPITWKQAKISNLRDPLENYHPLENQVLWLLCKFQTAYITYLSVYVTYVIYVYIYIFTMSCSHGQSGGAHQTASKGWRWSPWKYFQRSVLSICIRWCKGSSKLEHALRVQLHWQQKYVAYHKIDSYAQHVDSAFDKKDHRQKARGMSFCHMFLLKVWLSRKDLPT